LRVVLRSTAWRRLEQLNLGYNLIGDAGWHALANALALALTALALGGTQPTPRGLTALAKARGLSRLETLGFDEPELWMKTDWHAWLCNSPHLPRLRHLDLRTGDRQHWRASPERRAKPQDICARI
jgi:hypothetical protein